MDFYHQPPEGYHYDFIQQKTNVIAIWTVYNGRFNYNNGDESRCIWGFYNTKKQQYHAPINSKRIGEVVNIEDTSPYTAMPLRLSILEQCMI
tara:strand:+ start:2243 stop:2518 length:276 start_codon:yes stop_codon:yes gene_type:complete